MAGLMKNNFNEEVMVELSWIMSAIETLADKYGIESYEILLVKYRIQPEEEKAIDKFFALNYKQLANMTITDKVKKIAYEYKQLTNREWSRPDEIVEKLLCAKLEISSK